MSPYAEGTKVPAERSKAELEKIVLKYGASRFLSGWDQQSIVVGFVMNDRQIKLIVAIPSKDSPEVKYTPGGKWMRAPAEVERAWQAAIRQRWRALTLIVKAKLEAIAEGITTFDKEFLGDIVLPGGATVAQVLIPHLDELPNMLPSGAPPNPEADET